MLPFKKHISMIRGDTLSFGVHFQGLDNQDLDTAFFSCASNLMSNDFLFVKSMDNGIEKSEEKADTYIVRVDPDDTKNVDPGIYYYDLQVSINGDVFTVLSGNLTIKADISYDPDDFLLEDTGRSEVDPSEYFEALDASPGGLTIKPSDFFDLVKRMSTTYANKMTYFKGAYVKRTVNNVTKYYRAKQKFTPKSWSASNWEEITATATKVMDIKDLFTNMLDYVSRNVSDMKNDNKDTITTIKNFVNSNTKTINATIKDTKKIIQKKSQMVYTYHTIDIPEITNWGYKSGSLKIQCAHSSGAKIGDVTGVEIVGINISHRDLLANRIWVDNADNKNGTCKLNWGIRSAIEGSVKNAKMTVKVGWRRSGLN